MKRIIKSSEHIAGSPVIALRQLPPARESAPDPELEALRLEVFHLKAKIEAHEGALKETYSEGYENGFKDAQSTFEQDQDDLRTRITSAISAQQAEMDRAIDRLEILSIEISETALSKIFSPSAERSALVHAAIEKCALEFKQAGILEVRLSSSDFPDPDIQNALHEATGLKQAQIHFLSDVPSGAFEMSLKLGELNGSIPDYWTRLTGLFGHIVARELS